LCCSVCGDNWFSLFDTDLGCVAIGQRGLVGLGSGRVVTAFVASTTTFTATIAAAFAWLTRFACFTGLALFAAGFGCSHFTTCSGRHGRLVGQGQLFLGCVAWGAGALGTTFTTVCAFTAGAVTTTFAARLTFAAGLALSAQVWASFTGSICTATPFAATFCTAFGGSAFWTALSTAFRAAFATWISAAFATLSTPFSRPLRAAFGALTAPTTTTAARITATPFAAFTTLIATAFAAIVFFHLFARRCNWCCFIASEQLFKPTEEAVFGGRRRRCARGQR
jgi:hypothetical protein